MKNTDVVQLGNDPDDATEGRSEEKLKSQETLKPELDVFIESLLEAADFHCPSAWGPNISFSVIFREAEIEPGCLAIFNTPEGDRWNEILNAMMKDGSKFCLGIEKSKRFDARDEIETAVGRYLGSWEMPNVALGFALGLRTARLPKDQARVVLAAFLRNYGEER